MKRFKILLCILAILFIHSNAKCIWYGMCQKTESQYLYVDQEAKKLSEVAANKLGQICPELIGNSNMTCCNEEQIDIFGQHLYLAKIVLGDCPSCYKNFQSLFCSMTCDPNQHEFVRVAKKDENKCVNGIDYFISRNYKKSLFDSCVNVQNSGQPAVNMICQSENCTFSDFFKALGDSQRQAPFDINFAETAPKPFIIHENPIYKCSERVNATAFNPELSACTCRDCPKSCLAPKFIVDPAVRKIFNINIHWFAMLITFAGFLLIIVLGHLIYFLRKRLRQSMDDEEPLFSQSVDALKKKIGCQLKISAAIEKHMSNVFFKIGKYVSKYSYFFIISSIVLIGILGFGLRYFQVTTNPIELWSAPNSRGRVEKEFFDTNFKIEQIIMKPDSKYKLENHGPAWNKEVLKRVLTLQNSLTNLKVPYGKGEFVTLKDICFKPMHPLNDNCAITSPLEYFQNDPKVFECKGNEENFYKHIESCTKNPLQINEPLCGTSCFASSGIPINANIAFGGYKGENSGNATSIVITYLVNNSNNQTSEQILKAKTWEESYIEHLRKWSNENPDLFTSFSSERSIEDELSRQSESDIITVLLSYLVMFLYVTLTLGSYRSCKRFFVDIKITLGLGGVLIVMLAVVASIGLCSYFGVPASLISIEVIPFLVLAIGVDNIYIIVQTFENFQIKRKKKRLFEYSDEEENESIDEFDEISSMYLGAEASHFNSNGEFRAAEVSLRISKTLAKVGPSIFLASISESCAFFCGAITNMPAVRVFALYAGIAILINFFLQITFFLAILSLDAIRQNSNRYDVFCCLKMKKRPTSDELFLKNEPIASENEANDEVTKNQPFLVRVVSNYLAPFVLHKITRSLILISMIGWTCFCIAIIPDGLEIGLDQKLSMPLDSYVLKYFEDISTELKVGPPAYFVLTDGYDYSQRTDQNEICGSIGCEETSLNARLQIASNYPEMTKLTGPKFSWLDDYFGWLQADSTSSKCCRVYNNDTSKFCNQSVEQGCANCPLDKYKRPESLKDFNFFLPHFLEQVPNQICPRGGHAAYSSAVNIRNSSIRASYIMTYHSPMKTSDDFISAIRNARSIADYYRNPNDPMPSLTDYKIPEKSVFPYSIFYVFYDQYTDMESQTIKSISICSASIGLITTIILGFNILATLIVLIGVFQILLSVMAIMVLTGITLNAISLVNLVVSIGIGVEFCIHIVHEFTVSLCETRLQRANAALSNVGSSVLRGITLTKFGGILVLAFSKSRLFQVFYFRMYLSLVLFGALVGLIFIPVLLSFIGPPINLALLVERKTFEEIANRANELRDNTSDHDTEEEKINDDQ